MLPAIYKWRGTLYRELTDAERVERLREVDTHGSFRLSVRYAPCDVDGRIDTYGHAVLVPRVLWPPKGATLIQEARP